MACEQFLIFVFQWMMRSLKLESCGSEGCVRVRIPTGGKKEALTQKADHIKKGKKIRVLQHSLPPQLNPQCFETTEKVLGFFYNKERTPS